MTVRELIDKLQKYPMEATVVHLASSHYESWASKLAIDYEAIPGDYELNAGSNLQRHQAYVTFGNG